MSRVVFVHYTQGDYSGAAHTLYRLISGLNETKSHELNLIIQTDCELRRKIDAIKVSTNILALPEIINKSDGVALIYSLRNIFMIIPMLFSYLYFAIQAYKLLLKIRGEVVWCDNIRSFFLYLIPSKLAGSKIIWNVWLGKNSGIFKILNFIGLVFSSQVHVEYKNHSVDVFGHNLSKIFKHKIKVLYSGYDDVDEVCTIDLKQEFNLSPSSVILGTLASIFPRKRQVDIVHAFNSAKKICSNLVLIVCGDKINGNRLSTEYFDYLMTEISQSPFKDSIHFIGWRSDSLSIINSIDIFVSASEREGLPVAVREAMLSSVPVITTNVNGNVELVVHGCTGLLFDVGDVTRLAKHMVYLCQSEILRDHYGLMGNERLKSCFSNVEYINLFEKCLSDLK